MRPGFLTRDSEGVGPRAAPPARAPKTPSVASSPASLRSEPPARLPVGPPDRPPVGRPDRPPTRGPSGSDVGGPDISASARLTASMLEAAMLRAGMATAMAASSASLAASLADAGSVSESSEEVNSDVEMQRNKQRVRAAKRKLNEAQREEKRALRARVQAAEVASKEMQTELSRKQAEVERMTDSNTKLLAEKSELENRVHTERRRAACLNGDDACLQQCSDDDLDSLISSTTEALSRMQRTRADRLRTAAQCVVCQDRKRAVLLHPCRHMCVCEVCSHALQNCPLCRAIVDQKITVYL